MSSKNWLSEKDKITIAWLYKNTTLSTGKIADVLGFHPNTIYNYKNFKIDENVKK